VPQCSGIDEAVKDGAECVVNGDGDLVGGSGVGNIKPICAQPAGIGLGLEPPANMVCGPGEGEAF